jgi:phage host-nuclease inhibitor protein Gam
MPASLLLFFMIVVGIPIIAGVGSKMFRDWLAHKRELAQALNSQTAEKSAQYAAHTERLEQRVRVLERIVTDKGIAVADEIERLRDNKVS